MTEQLILGHHCSADFPRFVCEQLSDQRRPDHEPGCSQAVYRLVHSWQAIGDSRQLVNLTSSWSLSPTWEESGAQKMRQTSYLVEDYRERRVLRS